MIKITGMLLWFVAATALYGQAQIQTEQINKTISFASASANRVLVVENINGFVKVEGYSGDQVQLEARKEISAKNKEAVQKGMQDIQLQVKEAGDSIYVYLDAPFIHRRRGKGQSVNIESDRINYHYKIDMTLKVPAKANLKVSTINNGEVEIKNMTAEVKANHINGPVTITGATGPTQANTINGDIKVTYRTIPTADSKFKTINGNINVFYDHKLNATVSYKTMHGEFYTDVPEVEMLPVKIVKNSDGNGSGTTYKIDKNQNYKIGKGGPALSFQTLNGNMYLKQKKE